MPSANHRYHLAHLSSGCIVAQVERLETWWGKGRGVIGMPELQSGDGVWLPGVSAVHTLFVRFPLDLLFLSTDLCTVRLVLKVPPWRSLVRASRAAHTIELGAGTLSPKDLQLGDAWILTPISS